MNQVSRTVYLVFAIISLVGGAVLTVLWSSMILIQITLEAQFGSVSLSLDGYIFFYSFLIMSIVLFVVSILLFVLRARRKD